MRKFITLLAAICAAGSASADCLDPIALVANYSEYFVVGFDPGSPLGSLEISFEPDAVGAGATAVLGMEFCSRESLTSCSAYNYDSDGDGIADTNLLDGSTTEKSGVKNISGFQYLRVYASTAPGASEEAEFTICRRSN